MKHDKYVDLLVTNDYLEYEFASVGPKGTIPKIIQFAPTEDAAIVNLAFGNKKDDGSIDDLEKGIEYFGFLVRPKKIKFVA